MVKYSCRAAAVLQILLITLVSCADEKKNSEITLRDSTVTYHIPDPKTPTAQELKQIRAGAQLFYDTMLRPSAFNGGIIVAKNGYIVFEKYHGSVNLDGQDSINANTPMQVASVSKTFTAMAILKLQEQGKLSIDDPFAKYYPEFNYPGVTIKTLLNHRSGLPKYEYFMEKQGWDKNAMVQNRDVLQWLIQKKDVIEGIGTADRSYAYCNTNYALLALLIEKITGETFPAFMKVNIFDPLGLKNTFVHYTGDNKNVAKSFQWNGKEYGEMFLDGVYGDKNVYTTPRDLLIWDRALSDTVFLSAQSLEAAYTPYSNERPGIKNYGYGWHMNIYPDGKKIIFHNGWWHGSNAAFIRLLKDKATIIVISNRYARSVYKAKYLVNLFDHYFDVDVEEQENSNAAADSQTTDSLKLMLTDKNLPGKAVVRKRRKR